MPIQPASAMADRLQQEYDRLRMRHEYNAEFLHTKDMHNDLDYYERRKQAGQAARYQRAIWRVNNISSPNLDTCIYNGIEYVRLNRTFIIESSNQEMIDIFSTELSVSDLSRGEAIIHNRYRHSENFFECRGHSHWIITRGNSLNTLFNLRCAACLVDGNVATNGMRTT